MFSWRWAIRLKWQSKNILFYYINWSVFFRDFHHCEKTDVVKNDDDFFARVFEIAKQLLTCLPHYFAQWMNGCFSFVRCLYDKPNNTWLLGDMKFLYWCSTRYLSSQLSERVTSRVEHSERNSISPRADVLLSIYFLISFCRQSSRVYQKSRYH